MLLIELFDTSHKKAIFTAGLPASGKSTILKKLIGDKNLMVIDVDKFYALDIAKGKQPGDYQRYNEKANKQIDLAISAGKNIVLDGTGSNLDKYKITKNNLEQAGYETFLIYVATDLDVASIRASQRNRNVDPASYHQNLMSAYNHLTKMFGNNLAIIDNNSDAANLSSAQKAIDLFLKK